MLPATATSSRRFSLSRMFYNMFPPLIGDTAAESLTVAEQDRLFDFQISLEKPKKLCPASLYVSGVAPDDRTARKVAAKLESIGVLKNDIGDRDNIVDTRAITRDFANQLAILPAWRQKRLVCLLFIWEEELTRWRLLEGEEREICVVIDEEKAAGGDARVGHLEKRLMEIQGLARLKPSLRHRRASNRQDILPGYEDSNTENSGPR